jgi:hypothetical protein
LFFGPHSWPAQRRDQIRRDQDFVAVLIADGVHIAAGDSEDSAPDFEVAATAQRLPGDDRVEVWLPLPTLRQPQDGGAPRVAGVEQVAIVGVADSAKPRETKDLLGAELKSRRLADWVLDATFKPDFSQVEFDVPQFAGNTRVALSVPE